MDRLRISDEVFTGLTTALSTARTDLETTGQISAEVAEAVGHRGLADELRTFAGNWRITREKLTKSLTALGSQLDGVVETFTATDTKIADLVRPTGHAKAGEGA